MTVISEFTSAAISDRGLNEVRPHNEDAFLEMREFGIFAVADGVGGAQAGEVASQMAVEIIGEAFANRSPQTDGEETMRIALERANDAIYQMSQDLPQLSSMATTIVALHLNGDVATLAHVGDSRIYRIDATGQLHRETDDHSVVEEEVRAGRMTAAQALNHPSRNVISRALGAEYSVEPDIKCVMVQPADTFLLCSDGVTRHITDSEIESLLAFGGEPDEICARMKEICFARGAEDNLTALVVSFPGERTPYGREDDDIEEVTVAGVRESAASPATEKEETLTAEAVEVPVEAMSAATPGDLSISEELSTIAADSAEGDEAYLMEEPVSVKEPDPPAQKIEANVAGPAQLAPPVSPAPSFTASYTDSHGESSGSSLGKVFTGLALLLAGVLIGAVGSYLLLPTKQPVVEAPVITEQKSNNVTLTTFEETRRLVDADPVRYLNANAASPLEADDFFWLGRALLLTGKPVEAKRAFEQARLRLPTVHDPGNLKTMTNEIAIGLAVADSPSAVEALGREANTMTNTNANIMNNLTPVR